MSHDLPAIVGGFSIQGDFRSAESYGSGHINDSYRVTMNQGGRDVHYLVQRINDHVFTNPGHVMENIEAATRHIRSKLTERGVSDVSRRVLTLIPSVDGRTSLVDSAGSTWRTYLFIEGCLGHDVVQSEGEAFQAARAFGQFQRDLSDFDGELRETIPHFHDTPHRFEHFRAILAKDEHGRAAAAQEEIEFALDNEAIAHHLLDLHRSGAIPLRVTHNDTKLNNVLLDNNTGEGVCIIDLDTVMPGLALYDFGDLVRTSTSPAAEDERDLSLVFMQMPMFEALVRGYLEAASGFLVEAEIDNLPFAGKLISFEVGLRFLTDFLDGDRYFKVHRDGHNLDRCRTQFELARSITAQEGAMRAFVRDLAAGSRG